MNVSRWVAIAALSAAPLSAQELGVSGRLVDATTGAPIVRGLACYRALETTPTPLAFYLCGGHVSPDGRFTLTFTPFDSVIPGSLVEIKGHCSDRGATSSGRWLLSAAEVIDTVVVPAQSVVLGLDAGQCDQRPIEEQVGVFMGEYTRGFENFSFRWCGDEARRIWVEGVAIAEVRKWTGETNAMGRFWIKAAGTLHGPHNYGHLSSSEWLLVVDSLVALEPAAFQVCS